MGKKKLLPPFPHPPVRMEQRRGRSAGRRCPVVGTCTEKETKKLLFFRPDQSKIMNETRPLIIYTFQNVFIAWYWIRSDDFQVVLFYFFCLTDARRINYIFSRFFFLLLHPLHNNKKIFIFFSSRIADRKPFGRFTTRGDSGTFFFFFINIKLGFSIPTAWLFPMNFFRNVTKSPTLILNDLKSRTTILVTN